MTIVLSSCVPYTVSALGSMPIPPSLSFDILNGGFLSTSYLWTMYTGTIEISNLDLSTHRFSTQTPLRRHTNANWRSECDECNTNHRTTQTQHYRTTKSTSIKTKRPKHLEWLRGPFGVAFVCTLQHLAGLPIFVSLSHFAFGERELCQKKPCPANQSQVTLIFVIHLGYPFILLISIWVVFQNKRAHNTHRHARA